ncbi:MAG TPA: four helix bundle protein [Vicinamibacterales bacterium]|nr:four helix bundle protein [Vicinamibacterales bacterium]
MFAEELRIRTRQFAVDVVKLSLRLPKDDLLWIVRRQLIRSATGTASNYRAACRARSDKEFASRLGVVIEEADESELWLDILQVMEYQPAAELTRLRSEATQLVAIMVKSRCTTLENIKRKRLAKTRDTWTQK